MKPPSPDQREAQRASDVVSGADWTDVEVKALVADYFSMLREEIIGRPYSKADHRRSLMQLVARSPGAIEHKHQNVSAILHRLGFRWIDGYRPLGNAQRALIEEVMRHLDLEAERLDGASERPQVATEGLADAFVDAPQGTSQDKLDEIFVAHAWKFDVAKRDARNRELGRAGEEFVMQIERAKLINAGRHEEANLMLWASRDQGDGLGYDILSFDTDGSPLHIEVKTTRGTIGAPFFLTERERLVAARRKDTYRLYRVFQFGRSPKIFVLRGPLEEALQLRPTAYRASVAPQ